MLKVRLSEVNDYLKKMESRRTVGPNDITLKFESAWEKRISIATKLFNTNIDVENVK